MSHSTQIRLRDERLPPVMHLSWCQTFVAIGGDLDAVIYQVRTVFKGRQLSWQRLVSRMHAQAGLDGFTSLLNELPYF